MGGTTRKSGFDSFIGLIKHWLANLGVNSRIFVDMMGDEALPMPARTLATGVLIYLNLPIDIIPDRLKAIGLVDDVIVMIIGLSIIIPILPEDRLRYYKQKYEAVAKIDEQTEILKSALGILWDRLAQFVNNLRARSYKKKTTEEVVQSAELREDLFDETMIYIADLNLDPETISKSLPPPERVMGLLASGMEEEQERQDGEDTIAGRSRSALKRMLPSGNKDE
jgi:uncharacterized membrane protein YkvA (DUF1232 family)